MKELVSTVSSKGQITIPVEVREYLGIKTNDKIAFVIDQDGVVRLRVPQYSSVAALRGAAGRLPQPLSWQEMQQIAYEDRFSSINELSE